MTSGQPALRSSAPHGWQDGTGQLRPPSKRASRRRLVASIGVAAAAAFAALAAAVATTFVSTGGASAAPTGGVPKDFPTLQPVSRVMSVFHDWGQFLDAHEISSLDYNVVTRTMQDNNTQLWLFTDMGGGLYTIVQVSSGRFLDAHEIASLDYRVVTRPQQNNNTQLWRVQNIGGDYHTIQQVSSGRFLDSYDSSAQDFRAVTRPRQRLDTGSQQWRIVCRDVVVFCTL
jgi:hypothetical protein